MALPSYAWPPGGATARGVTIVPFGSGVVIPDWLTPTLWPYAAGAFKSGIVLATGTPGLAAAAADAASGVWTVSYAGTLWHQPPSGSATATALPSGAVYTGCATAGGSAFVLASSGTVLTSNGNVLGTFPAPGLALNGSGSTLAALLPASGLGTMTTGGATGLIAFPAGLTTPSCLSMVSGNPVAVGGWTTAASLLAANAAALSLADATTMIGVGSGTATVWRAASGLTDAWAQTQNLAAGLAVLTALSWSPDGFHIAAVSPTSGVAQVMAYAAGVLSLTQTLSVSGACATVFGSDNLHILVAQSGQSQLATLAFTSSWAVGTPVTGFPGITTIAGYGTSGAVAAYSGAVAWLTLASGLWSVTSSAAMAFTPTLLAVDPFLNTYAAASGTLAVLNSSGVVLGSGAFAGVPTGLVVQQGRAVLAVPASNALYIYGQSPSGAWSQQGSGALTLGAKIGLALSDTTLFCLGSGSTVMQGFSGTPFALTPVLSGVVAQRSGGAWFTTGLGIGHTPSAVAYDAAGHLQVATTENTIWTLTAGGSVLTSGVITQVSGQAQSVPLGVSAMTISPSGMYCTTSIPGLLTEIPIFSVTGGTFVAVLSDSVVSGEVLGGLVTAGSGAFSIALNETAVSSGGVTTAALSASAAVPGTSAVSSDTLGFSFVGTTAFTASLNESAVSSESLTFALGLGSAFSFALSESAVSSETLTPLPSGVISLRQTATTTTTMSMAWSPPPTGLGGTYTYNFAYAPDGSAFTGQTSAIASASFVQTGLLLASLYELEVQAVDSQGHKGPWTATGPWSTAATNSPAGESTSGTVITTAGSSITNSIGEKFAIAAATGRNVLTVAGVVDSFIQNVQSVTYQNHTVFVTDAGQSNNVFVKVAAAERWVQFTSVGGVPLAGPPGPVSNITSGAVDAHSIVINWSPSASGNFASSYQIGQGTSAAGPFAPAGFVATTTFTAGGASATTYFFQITPIGLDTSGNNVFGTPVVSPGFATTDAAPLAVTNIQALAITSNAINVVWTPPSGTDPVKTYGVSYGQSPTGPFTDASSVTSPSYQLRNGVDGVVISPSTTYYVRVFAYDAQLVGGPPAVSLGFATPAVPVGTPANFPVFPLSAAVNINTFTNPIVNFSATFTVPQVPTDINGGQTVIFWIGLEPADGSLVIQPCLTWSKDIGWSVSSYYVADAPGGLFTGQNTTPIPVTPGTVLTAVVACTGTSGGTYTYSSSFQGIAGTTKVVSGLPLCNLPLLVLEQYGVDTCQKLPNGNVVFSNISIKTGTPGTAGTAVPSPTWLPSTTTAIGCGLNMTVGSSSQVTFIMPTQ